MDFLKKLMSQEVQTKAISDVNVKELQRKLKKKGVKFSEQEIKQKLKEYGELIEEDRRHKITLVSFISTVMMLVVLAVELQLRTMNIFVLENLNHILFTIMGLFTIAGIWLRWLLLIKKKYKIARVVLICAVVIIIGLIIATIFV